MGKDNKKKAEPTKAATPAKPEKKAAPAKEEPKVEPVKETSAAPAENTDESTESNPLTELNKLITDLALSVKSIQGKLKNVAKEFEKQQKYINKDKAKREKAKNTKSGFTRPCKISSEMCDFIGVSHDTEMSRTDVTRHINKYVREKELHNPVNRRIILPDEKLKKLLKVTDSDVVTFFQLQKLISPHFPPPKSAQKAAAT